MLDSLSIVMHDYETKYTFSEWEECPDLLEITYSERGSISGSGYVDKITLPVFSKEDWEKFKQAGDIAFKLMGVEI